MNRLNEKMTRYRWVICSMLFFATTVNYLDRQVLSLTWKDFVADGTILLTANAKSVLSVLGACVKSGDEIEIVCEGEDEQKALDVMVQLVVDGLGE